MLHRDASGTESHTHIRTHSFSHQQPLIHPPTHTYTCMCVHINIYIHIHVYKTHTGRFGLRRVAEGGEIQMLGVGLLVYMAPAWGRVCVCEREIDRKRERECVSESAKKRESVCETVRDRERESMCV